MFTIIWLVRSFQGITKNGDENCWEDNWFLASLVTFMVVSLDIFMILSLVSLIILL